MKRIKTIILFRHSKPLMNSKFNNLDIPLSEEGNDLAKEMAKEFSKMTIKNVYSSNYRRALETAKCFAEDIIIDKRFGERELGDLASFDKDFWEKQYLDHNYKILSGESLNETKLRMTIGIDEVLKRMEANETTIIVSHAAAICSYLLNFCSIEVLDAKEKVRHIVFKDKVILSGKTGTPHYFILTYNNDNKLIHIK